MSSEKVTGLIWRNMQQKCIQCGQLIVTKISKNGATKCKILKNAPNSISSLRALLLRKGKEGVEGDRKEEKGGEEGEKGFADQCL